MMRSFALFQRKNIFLEVRSIEEDTKSLSEEHNEGLHVGMKKFAMMVPLFDVLTTHQLKSCLVREVPKVPIVPLMKKMATAIILALLSACMVINRLTIQ